MNRYFRVLLSGFACGAVTGALFALLADEILQVHSVGFEVITMFHLALGAGVVGGLSACIFLMDGESEADEKTTETTPQQSGKSSVDGPVRIRPATQEPADRAKVGHDVLV